MSKKKIIVRDCDFCNDAEETEFNEMWINMHKPKRVKGRKLKEGCAVAGLEASGTTYNFGPFRYFQLSLKLPAVYVLEMAFKIDSQADIEADLKDAVDEVVSDLLSMEEKDTEYDTVAKLPENKGRTKEEVEEDFSNQAGGDKKSNIENIQKEIIKVYKSDLGKTLKKKDNDLYEGTVKMVHLRLYTNDYVVVQFFGERGNKNGILQEIVVPIAGAISGWQYFLTTLNEIVQNIKANKGEGRLIRV